MPTGTMSTSDLAYKKKRGSFATPSHNKVMSARPMATHKSVVPTLPF